MTQRHLRKDQEGFTLLEMLVTVGIMAAVAGTATLALQDTTARASAAAHVLMMDELNEGIMTYRVLNGNAYPGNFDSMLEDDDGAVGAGTAGYNRLAVSTGALGSGSDLELFPLTADMVTALDDIGLGTMRYVDLSLDPPDAGDCADIQGLINNRGNAVVSGNIFLSPDANGCGFSHTLVATDTVLIWNGGNERVLGVGAGEFDDLTTIDAGDDVGAKIFMVVGAGPASGLFDASELGGMTSVPVYRHVGADEYNRFFILFHIATVVDTDADGTADAIEAVDQVNIGGVVDSAGDTKEEELGEWDGTRNTI
ncbi:MAG: type II secretion system protein [Pseudomonadota bacterium]